MIVTNIREKKSDLFYYNFYFYFYFYFYHSFFFLYIAFSPSLSLWSTFINWYMLKFSTPDIRNPGPLSNTNTNTNASTISPDTRHHSPLRRSPLPPSLSSSSFPPLSRSPPHSHINHNIVSRGYRSSNVTSSSSKPSFLILGDSNTKHIRLPLNFHRTPPIRLRILIPACV